MICAFSSNGVAPTRFNWESAKNVRHAFFAEESLVTVNYSDGFTSSKQKMNFIEEKEQKFAETCDADRVFVSRKKSKKRKDWRESQYFFGNTVDHGTVSICRKTLHGEGSLDINARNVTLNYIKAEFPVLNINTHVLQPGQIFVPNAKEINISFQDHPTIAVRASGTPIYLNITNRMDSHTRRIQGAIQIAGENFKVMINDFYDDFLIGRK